MISLRMMACKSECNGVRSNGTIQQLEAMENGESSWSTRDARQVLCRNPRNILILGCCWSVCFTVNITSSVLGPFFPTVAENRGVSSVLIGLIFSTSPFCVMLLAPLLGYYISKLGIKNMLVCGTMLAGGAFIILGFIEYMPSWSLFVSYCFLLQLTCGVGYAMVSTSVCVLAASIFHDHYAIVMGLVELAGGVGCILGPLVGGVLYQLGGFKLPFIVQGTIPLLLIIPLFILTTGVEPRVYQPTPRIVFKIIGNCSVILVVFSNVLAILALYFFTPTLSPFLVKQFGLRPAYTGLVYLADSIMYMTVSVFIGPLVSHCNTRLLIVLGLLSSGIAFFFVGPAEFISTPQLWVSVVSVAVIGFGSGLSFIVSYADIMSTAKSLNTSFNTGSLSAVTSAVVIGSFSCGELLGPVIGGVLTHYLGFQTSAMLIGTALLVQAATFILFCIVSCRGFLCVRI